MGMQIKTPSRGSWAQSKSNSPLHISIESALSEALAAHGVLGVPVIPDEKIHRFDAAEKKRGNRCGWYVCYSEVAVYGFWHTGEQHVVSLTGRPDPRIHRDIERVRREREEEQARRHAKASVLAREMIARARPASPECPYLIKKGVRPHNLLQLGAVLLVPLYHQEELVNLQRIYPDGSKRFLAGGRIKGAASLIGTLRNAEAVYLCEGWATGASIHEATSCPVVVAMNCNNLLPVATALRTSLAENLPLTVAADNDRHTTGNPGLTAGRQVSDAVAASLTWPRFPCESCDCSDFNDLARCEAGRVSV